jgi:hypothetical protein
VKVAPSLAQQLWNRKLDLRLGGQPEGLSWRDLLRRWRACHGYATALLWRAAIGDGAHDDFDPRLIFVHGAGRGIDAEADKAAKDDIARRHDLGFGGEDTNAITVALLDASDGHIVLLGRTIFPGVCTVRVPTAGEESVHMASCTPGVATDTCCCVPLTMVEQPVRRIMPHKAATPRSMAEPPGLGLSLW